MLEAATYWWNLGQQLQTKDMLRAEIWTSEIIRTEIAVTAIDTVLEVFVS